MSTFPKINLGVQSSKTRSTADLSHDVNTTSNFGHVQPLVCRLLPGDATIKMAIASVVRFLPLSRPTFGRVKYLQFHRFVNITDLWMPFENFLSGQPYNTSDSMYTPQSIPNATVREITASLYGFCVCTPYITTDSTPSINSVYKKATLAQFGASKTTFTSQYALSNDVNFLPKFTNESAVAETVYGGAVSFDGADMILYSLDKKTVYCLRFTAEGRNIHKVIIGCGLQVNAYLNKDCELLPLFAFYKAWYDAFVIQRDHETWTNTDAYKIMDYFRVKGISSLSSYLTNNIGTWFGFLRALANTYYTASPDFISAHTPDQYNEMTGTRIQTGLAGMNDVTGDGTDSGVYIDTKETGVINAVGLQLAQRLLPLININSVVGGRIAAWLKSVYNIDYIDEHNSDFIGSNRVNCAIGDVVATDTNLDASQLLGDFAGQGIGKQSLDDTQHFNFKTKSFGYWITLACVVPESGYNQGIDPLNYAITKEEFWNPVYDAIGFDLDDKDIVNGVGDVAFTPSKNSMGGFGYVPRFTAWRSITNKANGMFSLRSQRNSYLPFILDRHLTNDDVVATESGDGFTLAQMPSIVPTADVSYRTIGRFDWMGNYNRIFARAMDRDVVTELYDPTEDRFIIHNVVDMTVNSNMLSISNSYNTIDDDDHKSIKIESV